MRIGTTAQFVGDKLPYDRKVAYLESHGEEYILLPEYYLVGQRHEFKATYVNSPIGYVVYACFWGNNGNYGETTIGFSARDDYLGGSRYSQFVDPSTSLGETFEINVDLTSGNMSITSGGVVKAQSASSSTFHAPFALFAGHGGNNGEEVIDYYTNNRIYYYKLYQDSVLIYDFIPVVKNEVGYMYDKVSGNLFGNSASQGAFTWAELSAAQNGGGV